MKEKNDQKHLVKKTSQAERAFYDRGNRWLTP